MKRDLLLVLLIGLAATAMAQVKGAHPYKVSENEQVVSELSHWSLTPHIGFNYFDGDFNSEAKHSIAIPNAGLDVEYAFNPVWALGLSYMFDMYNVTGKPGYDNADTLLNGMMHKAGLYVSMDFMNLFYPKAKRKICGIQGVIGGGYGWYKNRIMYHDDYDPADPSTASHQRGHTAGYINTYGDNAPDYMTDYRGGLYLQAGLNVEFNLNRTLALGVRATYNYFINDYVDGRGYAGPKAIASKNNDGIVDVTLNMRFKLCAVSKTHVRNIASLDVAEPKVKNEPVYIHDTLILKQDSVIIRETIREMQQQVKQQSQIYYVYFDSNKSEVGEEGLITIQQVADRLAEDTTLYAVVTGYCDNTGTDKLNYALGDLRAENVITELRDEHGVSSDHMYSTGLGKLVGRRSAAAYGPNRRAAIRLVDKETFDRMKGELENKRANRHIEEPEQEKKTIVEQVIEAIDGQISEQEATLPISETSRPAKQNIYAERAHDEVVAEKSTTLSKLAREKYNNTYCWVYIYIANKDRIPNPNRIAPGTKIIIPELTEKEVQITKNESLILYGNARQNK